MDNSLSYFSRDTLSCLELIACKNALIPFQLMRWYLGVCQTALHINYVEKVKTERKRNRFDCEMSLIKEVCEL